MQPGGLHGFPAQHLSQDLGSPGSPAWRALREALQHFFTQLGAHPLPPAKSSPSQLPLGSHPSWNQSAQAPDPYGVSVWW